MQSPVFTAVSLLVAYVVFAVVGFVLAERVSVLKPAGMALFGTSLAILSVAAVPVNAAFIGDGRLTWLLTSLLGLSVYSAAALRLDSRVLGYLAVSFFYSAMFSSTAVLQQGLLWSLVLIMLLAAMSQFGMNLLGERLPVILTRPFGRLHWLVVPGAVLAGLLTPTAMRSTDYTVLFAAAGIYYLVCAVWPPVERFSLGYAVAARMLFTAAFISWLLTLDLGYVITLALITLWMAAVYFSMIYLPGSAPDHGRSDQRIPAHREAASAALVAALATALLSQMLMVSAAAEETPWLWLSVIVATASAIGAHEILLRRPGRIRRNVLRAFLILAVITSLPGLPVLGMVWLSIWILAERRLSGEGLRSAVQRGLLALWCAGLGWTVGEFGADIWLGIRLGLLALCLAAAGAVLHWVRRPDARYLVGEPLAWLILIPAVTLLHRAQASSWWWADLATAFVLLGLALLLVLRRLKEPVTAVTVPVYAALGAYLTVVETLQNLFDGRIGATSSVTGYLGSSVAFTVVVPLALWMRDRYPREASALRMQLARSAAVVALVASTAPMVTAEPGRVPVLAWVVPLMQGTLLVLAVRWVPQRLRVHVGLAGSLLLPLSGLFALYQAELDTEALVAGTGLLMLLAILLNEALIFGRTEAPGQPAPRGPGVDRDWAMIHYVTAGVLATLLALVGLGADSPLVQITPLVAAAALLTAGLLRARRLGLYWGAGLIVLAVLWSLRQAVFGLLIALGVLIIAAAVWRLLAVQKKQPPEHRPAAADPGQYASERTDSR
ncbi:hypothetical protein [Nesterenkonia massiliensis]|uniref:hypothetical protein n=1 Tax=Nesterenkonia massiliensis TaxID=1232429 RepID=UPI0005C993AD|nr:hypothetical protein [Nesterenkonia massiliensis]